MRTIKFRVWDKGKKVFIPTDVYAIVSTDFGAFGIMLKDWENYREGEYFYEHSQVLMQITGLFDKNGKEVYEGDILKVSAGYTGVIGFQDAMFVSIYSHPEDGEVLPLLDIYPNRCEIIGNIHENN